jgi:hypothetical protein
LKSLAVSTDVSIAAGKGDDAILAGDEAVTDDRHDRSIHAATADGARPGEGAEVHDMCLRVVPVAVVGSPTKGDQATVDNSQWTRLTSEVRLRTRYNDRRAPATFDAVAALIQLLATLDGPDVAALTAVAQRLIARERR